MKSSSVVATATDTRTFESVAPPSSDGDASPFETVPQALRQALEKRGFSELTVVQDAVLAAAADGRDLQISSQTGSGKTVAIGLALAPRLLDAVAADNGGRPLHALVIVPTRELAVQVSEELSWLYASVKGLTVECVTGGSSVGQERRRLMRRPTVVVGTPGRLHDHIRSNAIDCRNLSEVVLDEADRMLDMGFREELEAILDTTPEDRTTHLVSATFSRQIQKLAQKYQNNPQTVEGTRLGAANADIQHVGHVVRGHERYATMVNLLLLSKEERTLVFVNTRVEASELASKLVADGFAAAPISGELEQSQRTNTLNAFRSGVTMVLVATDVAARGIDVPEIGMVIQTDAPRDAESYTHRAGRTGRAGRKGRSVLLASPQRRRRCESLLHHAKVKLEWAEVPTAAAVQKALAKRERRRVRNAITNAPAPTEKQLSYASSLLEETDPATLVAHLLELAREDSTAAPRDIDTSAAPSFDRSTPERRSAYAERRPAGRERTFEARASHFEINYGRCDGATPQRLLALVCRRGDVSSRMIGAINIDAGRATFEVADSVAHEFEQRAERPDSRDPDLIIRRTRSSVASRPRPNAGKRPRFEGNKHRRRDHG